MSRAFSSVHLSKKRIGSQRSCLNRWFGKMHPESLRGSMLALSATAIGGGVLSLPYVCKLCGLGLGLIMIVLAFLSTLWSFTLIVNSDMKTGGHQTMKSFCLRCGGPKLLRLYEATVIFYLYGSLIGYQILISNLVEGVFIALEKEEDNIPHDFKDYRTYQIIGVAILLFPVCLLRSVNSLRYATLVSIGAIGYTGALLVVQMPYFWEQEFNFVLFKLDWNFFNAFGIVFFAFTCQTGFYSALDKLKKRDKDHKLKVAYRSCTINFSFYLVMMLAGYLSSFDNTPDVILKRKSPPQFKIPVIIAQTLIAGGLCVAIPLNYIPLRTTILNQIFGSPEYSFPKALVIGIIFSITSCSLAIFIPEINTVLSVLGGIGCVTICFIVPLIAYLTVLSERKMSCIISIFVCSVLVAVGIGSCTNAVYKMIGI